MVEQQQTKQMEWSTISFTVPGSRIARVINKREHLQKNRKRSLMEVYTFHSNSLPRLPTNLGMYLATIA